MRLVRLSENLDDQDEFGNFCSFCQKQIDQLGQLPGDDFHDAHSRADRIAADAVYQSDKTANLYNIFMQVRREAMDDLGYIEGVGDLWTRKVVKEDLDDRDQFGPECGYCTEYASEVVDQDRFHDKHEQAEIAAERSAHEAGRYPSSVWRQKYHDIFNATLWEFGYVRRDERGPWSDKPLKEDLDDKDEFGYPAISAAYYGHSDGHSRHVVVYSDGSRLYTHTLPSDAGGDYFEKFRDPDGNLHGSDWPGVGVYEAATNSYRNSYYVPFTPEIWADWKRAFGALTEDLDDRDEFHNEVVIYACIELPGRGDPSATRRHAREVSLLLGGSGEIDEVGGGCFDISVSTDLWLELQREGYLDKQVMLKNGKMAILRAEMP